MFSNVRSKNITEQKNQCYSIRQALILTWLCHVIAGVPEKVVHSTWKESTSLPSGDWASECGLVRYVCEGPGPGLVRTQVRNSLGSFSSPQVIKDGKFCYAKTITPQRYIYISKY